MTTSALVALSAIALSGATGLFESPQPPEAPDTARGTQSPRPGITYTVLLDNPTVLVAQVQIAPGAREMVHTHPFSAVVVQITPGQVDMRLGDVRSIGPRRPGFTGFIPRDVPHAAANAGRATFDVVTVSIKPDRPPASGAPATAARRGITRSIVLETPETRVTRVGFRPSASEPQHAHPFDLVLVQLTPGRMDVLVGELRTTKAYDAGSVLFLPRRVAHSVGNAGGKPFELISVAIK